MLVRRIARPLLSTVFIAGGIDSIRSPGARAQAAGPFIEKTAATLPGAVTDKLPSDPESLVKINGAIQVAAGVLLALGKAPRASSLVLAGTVVPTTLAGHDFWNVDDPQMRAVQRTQFFKNMTILGGLLIAAVDTEGKPSLGWRGRRAAKRAQESIADALSSNGSRDTELVKLVPERARSAAEQAGERGTELFDVARHRGIELANLARERGVEFGEVARERGPVLAELARERGAELAHLAKERGVEFGEVARERGPVLAELARERGAELAQLARERGSEWAATAGEQSEELGRRARKRAERALETARAKAVELQG
ncbi:putative membrane protein YphA (DoxX/SURF4 family) [Rhodococcus sp. LBL1]|nr:putative membrane protein YphA (DoxX/SURF4 family) [Rhodococcus sp. LBL1]MDH6685295.1 putative membrane protein YphA (DoxX/SURF4 family) [Rhodococcus sp. LBL2]